MRPFTEGEKHACIVALRNYITNLERRRDTIVNDPDHYKRMENCIKDALGAHNKLIATRSG